MEESGVGQADLNIVHTAHSHDHPFTVRSIPSLVFFHTLSVVNSFCVSLTFHFPVVACRVPLRVRC